MRVAEFDPRELERIEERLFALRAAGRKYNVPVDNLADAGQRYSGDLALIDAGAERLPRAGARKRKRRGGALSGGGAVAFAARRRAAQKLAKAVNAELKPLKLERAQFSTQIESEESEGPDGLDRVEFWVRTDPGTRPGPLMKIASGGELARFLLALESGAGRSRFGADVGLRRNRHWRRWRRRRRYRRAARAACFRRAGHRGDARAAGAPRADRHYLITKDALAKGRRVATRVVELEAERRREEIARMLAGAEITAEARAAAERLIRAAVG